MRSTLLLILCLCIPAMASAQDSVADAGYEARLELADKMLALNPPREQVESAIDTYINTKMVGIDELVKDNFRIAMMKIINHRALEKLSREAYSEIYTQEELAAMVEYYSKPEAASARKKSIEFKSRIYPEIIRMMDQAVMKAKTSSER